tara:strand:- start:102 stop:656 length:555 start_codon:yes stop_codon:yes gene_type:complete
MSKLHIIPGVAWGGGARGFGDTGRTKEKIYNIEGCVEKFGNSALIVGHRNNKHSSGALRNSCYGINNITNSTVIYTYGNRKSYPINEPLPNDAYDWVHSMACTNGGKIENLCKVEDNYVNPLGKVKPLDYKNSVSKLSKNYNIINEQSKDSMKKIDLANIELIVLASGLGISIIVLIVLLRNLK